MRFETLAIARSGPVAEIRLNRAARGNPIDALFLAELAGATAQIHDDPSVMVVLLTADGACFSSGRAPDESATAAPDPDAALPFRCLELMAQPVIAVIEGDASGAGLELALACDIRIAAEDALLALPDVALGHMPSAGATQRLPRLVGRAKAAEMILLGEPLSGAVAVAWGLVNHIAPRGEVRAVAERLAATVASRGPLAVRYAKEAMLRGLDMPLDQALRYETDLTVILQTTADRAEGVRAFLEKRPPKFEGR
jgi:enoyl-CoA hydratase/carnithine racemase